MIKIWDIDKAHSQIGFSINHLQLSTVKGSLLNFKGRILQHVPETFVGSKFYFEGDTDSFFTGHEERDVHLKTQDFFDCQNHSLIQFKSTEVNKIDHEHYFIKGTLSLKGVLKQVTLTAHFKGQKKGIDGENRIGFEMTCQLRPEDFDISWNGINEDGVPLIGEDVWVHICLLLNNNKN